MEPPGPPQRSLTWQAMEQIRYLRQEFPEEWPVARLAHGFHVSEDVIWRVLRSKFSPALERRLKQDEKVLGERRSREQRAGPSRRSELLAISGGEAGRQLLQPGAPMVLGGLSGSSAPQRNAQLGTARERLNRRNSHPVPYQEDGAKPVAGTQVALMRNSVPGGDCEEWDGQVLSEEELEELAAEGWDASTKVVQRGQEFFDSNGNFLYRILVPGEAESNVQHLPQSEAKTGREGGV
uniref:Neugrin n=1 Tax=Pelusios castaneus TaxID=367368 RepID=A0A8C8SJ00_9SAUR